MASGRPPCPPPAPEARRGIARPPPVVTGCPDTHQVRYSWDLDRLDTSDLPPRPLRLSLDAGKFLLRERHGKRASGVTYRLAPADPLRLMDMPQRRISDPGVEGICGYGLQTSHDGAPLRSSSDNSAPVAWRCPKATIASPEFLWASAWRQSRRHIRPMPATYESSSPLGRRR